MNKYYEEIEHLIKRNEVNKQARVLEDNYDTLNNYWNIGRLIVEAQGGEIRAKYGDGLIKEWSKNFTATYGSGYSSRSLKYMRKFYLIFQKGQPVVAKLSWSHYLQLLSIKDLNKRNFYINLCLEHNLSKRELIKEIKNNSYERLDQKPNKIEIKNFNNNLEITSNIMNPIIIYIEDENVCLNHQTLEREILGELQAIFRQLGNGYTLVGNEYKITENKVDYYIDILLFNYISNRFVVLELKTRKLKREDKSQVKFYMDLVNKYIKQPFHNNTLGIIISKEQDNYVATFVREKDIIPVTYELKNK